MLALAKAEVVALLWVVRRLHRRQEGAAEAAAQPSDQELPGEQPFRFALCLALFAVLTPSSSMFSGFAVVAFSAPKIASLSSLVPNGRGSGRKSMTPPPSSTAAPSSPTTPSSSSLPAQNEVAFPNVKRQPAER